MFFDISRILFPAVIIQPTDLIRPNGCQHQRAVFGFSLDRATLEVKGLNDSLKKQFDGFLPIFIQVILPRAILGWKLVWSQHITTDFFVFGTEILFAESRVSKHHIGYLKPTFFKFRQSDFSLVQLIFAPDREKRNRFGKTERLHHQTITLNPSAIPGCVTIYFQCRHF